MAVTLAFDVYGTLVDTAGVAAELEQMVGANAAGIVSLWRNKQLEYSFRRAVMRQYRDFDTCTRQALEYACAVDGIKLSDENVERLMETYLSLPCFADVKDALTALSSSGFRLFAFSNGVAASVAQLLRHAGIDAFFSDVISVDEIMTFKPDPAVYAHFMRRAGSSPQDTWLISSNPFDVSGAVAAGLRAAWVRRADGAVFDSWEFQPDLVVGDLSQLYDAVGASR